MVYRRNCEEEESSDTLPLPWKDFKPTAHSVNHMWAYSECFMYGLLSRATHVRMCVWPVSKLKAEVNSEK